MYFKEEEDDEEKDVGCWLLTVMKTFPDPSLPSV